MHTRAHAIVFIVSIYCLLIAGAGYIRPFLLEPARLTKLGGPSYDVFRVTELRTQKFSDCGSEVDSEMKIQLPSHQLVCLWLTLLAWGYSPRGQRLSCSNRDGRPLTTPSHTTGRIRKPEKCEWELLSTVLTATVTASAPGHGPGRRNQRIFAWNVLLIDFCGPFRGRRGRALHLKLCILFARATSKITKRNSCPVARAPKATIHMHSNAKIQRPLC